MITKQQLENTYIYNDRGELFDLYMEALNDAGATMCASITGGDSCKLSNVIYYDQLGDNAYCVKLGSNFKSIKKGLAELTLADLRKNQKPTVFDAVNYHKGVWPYVNRDSILNEGIAVCDKQEFNQCADDLAMFANLPSTVGATEWCYKQHKLDNPQPKPRTKVDYVLIEDFSFSLKKEFEDGKLYCGGNDYMVITIEDDVAYHSQEENLYRKVETKLTWRDELDTLLRPHFLDPSRPISSMDDLMSSLDGWDEEVIKTCKSIAKMESLK